MVEDRSTGAGSEPREERLVLVERYDGVGEGGEDERIAVVTLNRPEALNALSRGSRRRLVAAFRMLAGDESVGVVVLTGAGRAFTVGLDLKALGGETGAATALDDGLSLDVSRAMAALPQPIIGAVNGFAITGGFEIALLCYFLIASPEAQFADTHARVGVVPGWGLSQRLPRLIGINRAKALSLTANYLDAETACAWGLVNRVVPADRLLETALSLAGDLCSTEPVTRRSIKRLMDQGGSGTLEEGLERERDANARHRDEHVRLEKVAARRAAVQARGRLQSG